MKNKKKKVAIFDFILLIIIISLLIYSGLRIRKYFKKEQIKIITKINNYPYKVTEKNTKIYKNYFYKLNQELQKENIDEKKYASLISALFVADFYDTSYKNSRVDVGGLDFIHSKLKNNFKEKAMDTYYKYLKINDKKNKVEIKKIIIGEIKNIEYTENQINDLLAYEVAVEFTTNEKKDHIKITIVHENGLLSIVRII